MFDQWEEKRKFYINFVSLYSSCFPFKTTDFSKYDFPKEIWLSKPCDEIIYKLLLLLPIILCGIIGNVLLLNIIIRNRALHTPTNYILANMISADTMTICICPAMFMCSDFFQNFILGPIGCKLDGFIQGFSNFIKKCRNCSYKISAYFVKNDFVVFFQ